MRHEGLLVSWSWRLVPLEHWLSWLSHLLMRVNDSFNFYSKPILLFDLQFSLSLSEIGQESYYLQTLLANDWQVTAKWQVTFAKISQLQTTVLYSPVNQDSGSRIPVLSSGFLLPLTIEGTRGRLAHWMREKGRVPSCFLFISAAPEQLFTLALAGSSGGQSYPICC